MAAYTEIDHLTVVINIDLLIMEEKSTIGRSNWITGFPTKTNSLHFQHQSDRIAELRLGESASVTKSHHLDCTNKIELGRFSTIAGYNSQFLTHSIDVHENIQHSSPIIIGEYTFVGTNVVVLGGAVLPPYSVLGAKSLLNQEFFEEWTLYGGVPARSIKKISKNSKYFNRVDGFVY
ncbi:hypothetical protein GCM10023188_35970 [Pontibacter saemangeumensis]|uniref:Acyltransferase n=1 Tax=Pontibacter saemangeumensis TaxID=1084525 RepID=A0ABP8LXF8_9BACT